MAEQQCNTPLEIIKITASQLRAGRRVLICVLNDDKDTNLSEQIELSSNSDFRNNGDFWVSFGNYDKLPAQENGNSCN